MPQDLFTGVWDEYALGWQNQFAILKGNLVVLIPNYFFTNYWPKLLLIGEITDPRLPFLVSHMLTVPVTGPIVILKLVASYPAVAVTTAELIVPNHTRMARVGIMLFTH